MGNIKTAAATQISPFCVDRLALAKDAPTAPIRRIFRASPSSVLHVP
jgi:hypothetical protein